MKSVSISTIFLLFIIVPSFGQSILDPDDFHGPRTKWVLYEEGTDGATRASITPTMRGLSMDVWYHSLEATGANAATFNLEARGNLLPSGQPLHVNPFTLTEEEIHNYEFTPEQRNEVLLAWLNEIQTAYDAGLISGNIKFHIHQRLYPNKNIEKENQFVTDFSDFINAAKAANLDHWIAGIRLGENGVAINSINYILTLAKQWATEINANTGDWLKTHGLEMSGSKLGLYFDNIHNRPNSPTFFEEISKQTGYFAFCYKHFNGGGFASVFSEKGYDLDNPNDWETFIYNDAGFSDLLNFINTFKAQYPMHANVIFIGDSSDTMRKLTSARYTALTKIFTSAGVGFSGIIGVSGYTWRFENDIGDIYNSMYIVNPTGTTPQLQPLSKKRWELWPINDTNSANLSTIDAMASFNGTIHPSGPVTITKGDNKTFTITPIDGYEIENVLVDGISQGNVSSYTFNNITNPHSIQATFKLKTLKVKNYLMNTVSIYPNPVVNKSFKLNLNDINISIGDPIFIQLTNLTGQKVFEKSLNYDNDLEINLPNQINNGIYFLTIDSKNLKFYEKLVLKK
jgi:hypothetical protein